MTAAPSVATYTFPATVLDVHDGDTVKVAARLLRRRGGMTADLGFHTYVEGGWVTVHVAVRLLGINAPELATPEGKVSKAYIDTLIKVGDVLTLRSAGPSVALQTDKYGGRWDGVLVRGDGMIINDEMVRSGHAVVWDGKGPKPV